MNARSPADDLEGASDAEPRDPRLTAFGERLRTLRARRGLTRKAVAQAAEVSERYLANLEHGTGNASLLILDQIARALQCSVAEVIGDATTASPEWLMIRQLLEGRSEAELARARAAIGAALGSGAGEAPAKRRRIALIGLRGAGKSTLGRMLADDLELPFVELSRVIEQVAGVSVREIQDLYGVSAYRRYERRALDETLQHHAELVLATPGGLVSDVATFNQLLDQCTTVWLQAAPEDHMERVAQQGDMRPMAASREAMDDLRRILAGRSAFYSKAQLAVDTSRRPLAETFQALRLAVRQAIGLPA